MSRRSINLSELRAQLARRGCAQWRLAAHLGISPSSLSGYFSGKQQAPIDLRARIERFFGLPENALALTPHEIETAITNRFTVTER